MYSGIYISLILWLVLSTRKEDQISMTQLKEETQRYLPPGFILDFSPCSFSRENRGWLCHLDTYIPVNFLIIGQTEGWNFSGWGKESLKGLRLDISQLTPAIDSSNQRLGDGKKRDRSCMPLRYPFHSISVIISSDRPNTMIQYYLRWSMLKVSTGQGICHADICISITLWISTSDRKRRDTQWRGTRVTQISISQWTSAINCSDRWSRREKEKHAAEKNVATWRGSHVSQIRQSTPVINYSDRRNRRGGQWERRPEDIYIYMQSSTPTKGEGKEISGEKEAQKERHVISQQKLEYWPLKGGMYVP